MEIFHTGWATPKQDKKGICVFLGEDDNWYPGYVDEKNDSWNAVVYMEGDAIQCPFCCATGKLIHRSTLGKHGVTFGVQALTVERIEDYTTLLYWIIRRHIDEYGFVTTSARPREALVLDERGRQVRFSHTKYTQYGECDSGEWEFEKRFLDPAQKKYYSWDGGFNKKMGTDWIAHCPDLEGATAEKTGLKEYLNAGGEYPAIYLHTWRKHPQIENVLKAGWKKCIIEGIEDEKSTAHAYDGMYGRGELHAAELDFLDWNEVKPHRMLHMTKAELKEGVAWGWDLTTVQEWRRWEDFCSANEYDWRLREIGGNLMMEILARYDDGEPGYEFRPLMNYIDKQKRLGAGEALSYLIDCRRMAEKFSADELTEVQLWPPHLFETHERLSRMTLAESNVEERIKYERGFKKIYDRYKDLEWNDGELCIKLPKHNGELIQEGEKLDHCVGGYGANHIKGKDVIFFVRKYRRPERSYFTLDIRMIGTPKQVQLHGYKNERLHWGEGGLIAIPPKVLLFVERWKKEVLFPWYEEQQKKEMIKEKKGHGKSKQHGAAAGAA